MKTRSFKSLILVGLLIHLLPTIGQCYYNASTGRWLSRDPIGEKGGHNVYAFVLNGPLGRFDKDGREAFTVPPHNWTDIGKNDPGACQYGSVRFSADFYVNSEPKPLYFAPPGASQCVRRFAWPVDCVCKGMTDEPVDKCVRGCLADVYRRTGAFPTVSQHLQCVGSCTGGDPTETAAFFGRLSSVLLSCAQQADCYVGFAGGLPGEYKGDCRSKAFSCCFGCPYRIIPHLPPLPPIINF